MNILAFIAGLWVVVFAYSNTFENGFHFDDSQNLCDNVYVRSLWNIPRYFVDARTFSANPENATYRPLVTTTFAIDYYLGGGVSPRAFHVSQLVELLILWCLLVFFYAKLASLAERHPSNLLLAIGAATFFAVHPTATETMNLMHVRSEIQSAIGLVAAMLSWLSSGTVRRYHLAVVPMAFGMFAKLPAVLFGPLLAGMVVLIKGWRRECSWSFRLLKSLVREVLRATWLACVVGGFLFVLISRMNAPGQTYGGGGRFEYYLTQIWAVVHYVRLFFLPFGLSVDAEFGAVTDWWDTRVFAGVTVLVGIVSLARLFALRRATWPVAFGLLWFLLGLLPTSLVPLGELVNDHRIFLPYIGLTFAMAWVLSRTLFRLFDPGGNWAPALLAGTILALTSSLVAETRERNLVYASGETLWRDAVTKGPRNGRAQMNYGVALMARGEYASARAAFEKAAELTPNYTTVFINLGVLESASGNVAKAEKHFRHAISLAAHNPAAYGFYASFLQRHGRGAEAIPLLIRALELSPASTAIREALMNVYLDRKNFFLALHHASAILRIQPDHQGARSVSKRAEAALKDTQPGTAGAVPANASYGTCITLSLEYYQERFFKESILAAEAALKIVPRSATAHTNICAAYSALGEPTRAIEAGRVALEIDPKNQLARSNVNWALSQLRRKASE